jgi:hypothetical protein
MELRIKSWNESSAVYSFVEFQLNGTLIADFMPNKKQLMIYDTDSVYTKKCASVVSAINQVVKFHKKNF